MKPLRLLHVVPTYLPAWRHGGPVAAVHGLCKALVARGHEVTVFTTDVHGSGTLDVPRAAEVSLDGVRVWYFPVGLPRRLYRSPAMAAALARRLAAPARGETSFDLVHLHSVFLWPTAAAARAAERAGVPYLLAPRGMLVHDLMQRRGRLRKWLWIRLVERRTLARAAALHVTSDLEAAEIDRLGLVAAAPMVLIENGVEIPAPEPDGPPEAEDGGAREARAASAQVQSGLDRLSTGDPHRGPAGSAVLDDSPGTADLGRTEAGGRPAGTGDFAPKSHGEATGQAELSASVRAALARRPLLLFLGRVSWKKGLDRLIPALAGVPGATLAIAGNDEEGHGKQLEQLAAAQGVTGRVLFLGPVHGAAKAALLHGADLLVLPSYSENFGNVVLEAMAAALPVIVTPEVGLAAVVRDSGAGLVAEGDPPRLAAALRGLLADAGLRRAMGKRGAAEVARRFGWDTIAGRMEEVYRQILAAGGDREGPR